jgi:hypothetical protein
VADFHRASQLPRVDVLYATTLLVVNATNSKILRIVCQLKESLRTNEICIYEVGL